jgi:hypothetical protein
VPVRDTQLYKNRKGWERGHMKMEAIRLLTKYLHGATSQKTAFFIVTVVKTSNLT